MAKLPVPAAAPPRAAPPRRTLAVLALAVLAVHALVLVGAPLHWGAAPDETDEPPPPLLTRRIVPLPPAEPVAAPPPPPAPKPRPRPPAPRPQAAPLLTPDAHAVTAPPESPPESPPEPVDTAAEEAAARQAAVDAAAAQAAAQPAAAASAPVASAEPADPPPTPVNGVTLPGSVTLGYKVIGGSKGLTYYASSELNWRNGGTRYDAQVVVSAFLVGSRSMSSTGTVGEHGLAPEKFTDKSRSEVAAHFDPTAGQVIFSANTPPAPWLTGAQDRVSVFMQLGGMLAARPGDFPAGTQLTMYTVGPRSADSWTFVVEAEETLQLPFGELATVKLARVPRREHDQKVEVWLAPVLGYLPVRNRLTQSNGDFLDQQLNTLARPGN